jgi:hypothetical protein
MAHRDLTTPTMATITAAWLDAARERPLFEAAPRLSPFLGDIEAVHEGLTRFQRRDATTAALLTAFVARSAKFDVSHDRLARGLWNTMTGMADLLGEGEESEALLVARDELLPHGLLTVNLAYSDEVGNALLALDRLSEPSRAAIKKHGVLGKKLTAWVAAWRDSAKALGEAEAERVERLGAADLDVGTPADAVRARNDWIRVVSFVVGALPFEKSLDAGAQRRILQHLEAADARAVRARDRARGPADDEAQPEGEPAPRPVAPPVAAPVTPAPKPAPAPSPADHASPASPVVPAPPPA